ncbi:MAG TPA: TIGR03435 family protein [Vicinamibacterales bacterium]|jgi:uncharacterized protein (TIGR03435 family)|nr:TIGR03435 family protein [Vicinamibacterales bacterium]
MRLVTMNIIRHAVAILVLPVALSGQARPAFDVASIRPSPPDRSEVAIGVRITGAQLRISQWPLKEYLAMAYRVRPQQITGPDSLSTVYDIAATIPAGVPQDTIPEMLQTLFADRFQMKAHLEKKQFPVYALEVGKEGLKIKEATLDPGAAAAPAATNVQASGGNNGITLDGGDGSSFVLANNRVEVRRMTMERFAGLATRFLDRPVVDFTGLTGRYDLTIDIAPEDYTAMMVRAAVSQGIRLPPQALQAMNLGSLNPLKAGMERAGFRLEAQNAPLDLLVVESIAKAPSEN